MTKNERSENQKKVEEAKQKEREEETGGIHLAGKRCPRLTESGQVKKETVVSTVSTTDKFTIMYLSLIHI